MGWWFVRQPNGRLARFSTIVEDFTHSDLGEDEAREIALDGPQGVGRTQAARMVEEALGDAPGPFTTGYGPLESDGLNRYRKALETIRAMHGPRVARERERELSAPPATEGEEADA